MKKVMSAYINVETLERARNASYWTPGLSLNQLIELAMIKYIEELEKERGYPFSMREKK